MSQKVLVNCSTGESVRMELPPEEVMHLSKVAADWHQAQASRTAEHARREAIVGRLADAVGVPVDELKRALGVITGVPENTAKSSAGVDK